MKMEVEEEWMHVCIRLYIYVRPGQVPKRN